mmetsp:Transcript_20190/g.46843  ORF Transcript_20190/g.46843 Transcript_20190/m.46843 type:complete len:278 (+) Transcript_20190:1568-2401(+)
MYLMRVESTVGTMRLKKGAFRSYLNSGTSSDQWMNLPVAGSTFQSKMVFSKGKSGTMVSMAFRANVSNFLFDASCRLPPMVQKYENTKYFGSISLQFSLVTWYSGRSSESRSLVKDIVRWISSVTMCSLHSFRTNARESSVIWFRSPMMTSADPSKRSSMTYSAHDFATDSHGRYTGSRYTIPQRETVAGDATARSLTSNIIDMVFGSLMRSPLLRHSVLLSSSTVFMLSIQIASTGPSQLIHFLALSPFATELHASRTMVEMMPSVHSFVSWLNSP